MNLDKVVESYVKLRDKLREEEKQHKERVAPLKEAMQKLEVLLLKHMNSLNVKSIKTSAGTAYQTEFVSAKVEKWEDVLEYVRKNNKWNILQRAVNKTAVLEEKNVPGVAITKIKKVNIRRS